VRRKFCGSAVRCSAVYFTGNLLYVRSFPTTAEPQNCRTAEQYFLYIFEI
jgi:hypothetical protein